MADRSPAQPELVGRHPAASTRGGASWMPVISKYEITGIYQLFQTSGTPSIAQPRPAHHDRTEPARGIALSRALVKGAGPQSPIMSPLVPDDRRSGAPRPMGKHAADLHGREFKASRRDGSGRS
jgi:hypothetical protein